MSSWLDFLNIGMTEIAQVNSIVSEECPKGRKDEGLFPLPLLFQSRYSISNELIGSSVQNYPFLSLRHNERVQTFPYKY